MGSTRNGARQLGLSLDDRLLSDDLRAELIALTGHDLSPDDPALVLVALNQLLLPQIAADVVEQLQAGLGDTVERLDAMRKETLQATAGDLLLLAGQAREALKIDMSVAEGRAARIVAGLDGSIRVTRLFWACIGFLVCAVFVLGFVAGKGGLHG